MNGMEKQAAEELPLKGNDYGDDVPPVILQQGEKKKQYIAAIATTLGSLGLGTALAWTSPALPYLASNSTILNEPIDEEAEAWIGSLIAIGAIIGAIPAGYIADTIGRKWTIIGLSIPFILSWCLITIGTNVWYIYVARLLAGFSSGGISVVAPMYIGEIAEASIRGALGSYFEVLLCIGIMVVYLVGALVDYVWLAIIMGIIPISSLVIFLFMPDTPTYHLKKGDKKTAASVLQFFRGVKYNVAPEIRMLEKELEEAKANSASFRDLLRSRANINALIVSLGLMFFQQMSGVNIVIFYTANIFNDAGSTLHPDICAVIIGTVQAIITYVSLLLVDRAGRRILLFCSAIPSCCCLIVLGTFFYLKEHNPEVAASIGWIPLTAVNIFVISMALGFGPIPWMMMGELFSSSFKGVASSITAITNWALVFFVTKTYVNFVKTMGIAGAFWFYAAVTMLGIVFIYFRVPETKGKTFLEIQNMLASR